MKQLNQALSVLFLVAMFIILLCGLAMLGEPNVTRNYTLLWITGFGLVGFYFGATLMREFND